MRFEKKSGGRPSKKPSNDELDFMYKKMTAKEIAKYYKVSEHTVRNWIQKARKEESVNDK